MPLPENSLIEASLGLGSCLRLFRDLIWVILVASPMGEQSAKPSPNGGDSQRSMPTPFLTKTYQLVDDEAIDHVISWNHDGSTFIVWNTITFATDLLPKYFKHNNFTSFLRQLNTYVIINPLLDFNFVALSFQAMVDLFFDCWIFFFRDLKRLYRTVGSSRMSVFAKVRNSFFVRFSGGSFTVRCRPRLCLRIY